MRIYLLRHAESTSNKANMADSQIDAGLSAEGKKDIERLNKELEKIRPDVFFVSPLKRTLQTIKSFLDTVDNPVVMESELLLERDLGDYTGTPMGTFQGYCDENNLNRVTTRPPNGESLMDVYQKAMKFLEMLNNQYQDKKILVCGSKNNIMCLQIAIEGKDIADYYSFKPFETGELRVFSLYTENH